MDDLLKEAIADAKAVRETALENAKMALEEAFTPRLQSMLSKKIQTELEDDEDEFGDEEEPEMDAEPEMDMEPEDEEGEEEMDMEGVIEINGIKYAPVIEQEDEEGEEDEYGDDEEEENPFAESEDLDLEAVIKELEAELDEADEPDAAKGQTPGMPNDVEEGKEEEVTEEEEVDESKDEVDEQSTSSGIGKGTGVKKASASDEEDPGKGKLKEANEKEVDEDIDLDEVLKALSEEEDVDEEKNEVAKLKSDLDEHRSVIETLRGKLNEVNLLNAKLLFTNKLFRKYGLNNEQKMKVVEQFDRAGTLREVKLVYSTLGESFGTARNEINESKGAASKPVASTKSEKEVISEGNELRDRFKKLANLI
jgi:hypothetical protein